MKNRNVCACGCSMSREGHEHPCQTRHRHTKKKRNKKTTKGHRTILIWGIDWQMSMAEINFFSFFYTACGHQYDKKGSPIQGTFIAPLPSLSFLVHSHKIASTSTSTCSIEVLATCQPPVKIVLSSHSFHPFIINLHKNTHTLFYTFTEREQA